MNYKEILEQIDNDRLIYIDNYIEDFPNSELLGSLISQARKGKLEDSLHFENLINFIIDDVEYHNKLEKRDRLFKLIGGC